MLSAEFLAMILIVVYVGAVAVLFLFVVMMLDVDFAELKQGFLQYLPIGALIGVVFLIELILVGATVVAGGKIAGAPLAVNAVAEGAKNVSNVKAIGEVLYTTYVYYFEAAGLILLVAMVGAIVLTLHPARGCQAPKHRPRRTRAPRLPPWSCARFHSGRACRGAKRDDRTYPLSHGRGGSCSRSACSASSSTARTSSWS